MSNPQQRRGSPRRKIGGMHPGWKVFLCAFGSGCCTMFTIAYAAVRASQGHHDNGWLLFAVAAGWLFIVGGRTAERLWERE